MLLSCSPHKYLILLVVNHDLGLNTLNYLIFEKMLNFLRWFCLFLFVGLQCLDWLVLVCCVLMFSICPLLFILCPLCAIILKTFSHFKLQFHVLLNIKSVFIFLQFHLLVLYNKHYLLFTCKISYLLNLIFMLIFLEIGGTQLRYQTLILQTFIFIYISIINLLDQFL